MYKSVMRVQVESKDRPYVPPRTIEVQRRDPGSQCRKYSRKAQDVKKELDRLFSARSDYNTERV